MQEREGEAGSELFSYVFAGFTWSCRSCRPDRSSWSEGECRRAGFNGNHALWILSTWTASVHFLTVDLLFPGPPRKGRTDWTQRPRGAHGKTFNGLLELWHMFTWELLPAELSMRTQLKKWRTSVPCSKTNCVSFQREENMTQLFPPPRFNKLMVLIELELSDEHRWLSRSTNFLWSEWFHFILLLICLGHVSREEVFLLVNIITMLSRLFCLLSSNPELLSSDLWAVSLFPCRALQDLLEYQVLQENQETPETPALL